MSIIPKVKVEQLQFCESHWPVWTANAAAIGLSTTQTTNFKNFATAARAAYDAAQTAKQAYHAAVTNQNQALRLATDNAADLIRVIKGFAELTSNPNAVYSLAQIPPPATPVPAAAPGKPTDINVTLESSGAVTFTWEATNSAASGGAFFNISRKLPGQTSFTPLGGTSGSTSESRRMTFTDATVPTSAAGAGAQYIIQGQRGTLVGLASDAVVVQFGVEDGPGFSVTGATANANGGLKVAA
jgi:hypothetical protein